MEESNRQSQAPQPANVTPVSANNSSKSKIIPIGLGILFVLIAIGAYLLGTKQSQPIAQTPIQITPIPSATPVDSTANWKTYTGETFTFKYPISWKESKDCKFGQTICVESSNMTIQETTEGEGGGSTFVKTGGVFSVTKLKKVQNLSFDSFCSPGGGLYVRSCTTTTVNGLEARKRVEENPESGTTYLVNSGNIFYFLGLNYDSNDQNIRETLDQILSTFKFTNP